MTKLLPRSGHTEKVGRAFRSTENDDAVASRERRLVDHHLPTR